MRVPPEPEENEVLETFPMRVAARLSGVAPERLRAWESRYGAVEPLRTEGGTRRYTLADLDRLRLLREAVDAGCRIGDIAGLDTSALRGLLPSRTEPDGVDPFEPILRAIEALDATALRRRLEAERDARGPVAFARECVLPLAVEIGDRWEAGALSVAAEHLATGQLRAMLLELLDESVDDPSGGAPSRDGDEPGPRIVFATPPGERHDLGLLVAAVVAREAGARPIVIGADTPEEDLLASVRRSGAEVLALGFVMSLPEEVEEVCRRLRRALPSRVAIWTGGKGCLGGAPVRGVDRIPSLDQLAAHVAEASRSAVGGPAEDALPGAGRA